MPDFGGFRSLRTLGVNMFLRTLGVSGFLIDIRESLLVQLPVQ